MYRYGNEPPAMTMDNEKRDSLEMNGELKVEEARPFLLAKEEQDEEAQHPSPPSSQPAERKPNVRLWISIVANCLATIGIVFINKTIFLHPRLQHSQVSFAAFHFLVTFTLLYVVSRPSIAMFQPKPVSSLAVLPLALAMIFNVVLPNASLAYSSIQFYQIARVLLTPVVALLNYVLYGRGITASAALTLLPICVGVAVVSYFDTKGGPEGKTTTTTMTTTTTTTTTPMGVGFALAGVVASSVYTVWIKRFHEVLGCSSMQLLINQAPVSVGVMLFIIPFSDDVTVWPVVESETWILILLSGLFACVINLTQFIIIEQAGAVSSTVVGHFKTCSVVAMGWMVSKKPLTDGSLVGIVLALGGIFAYQHVTKK